MRGRRGLVLSTCAGDQVTRWLWRARAGLCAGRSQAVWFDVEWQAHAQVTKYVLAKAHTAVTVLHPATSGSGQQMEKNLKHVGSQHK